MALVVILDASVLYPLPLRDTLLRIAETGLYDPCWSERILDEVGRNLIAKRGATNTQAKGLLGGRDRRCCSSMLGAGGRVAAAERRQRS
jgi:hypothetical protein